MRGRCNCEERLGMWSMHTHSCTRATPAPAWRPLALPFPLPYIMCGVLTTQLVVAASEDLALAWGRVTTINIAESPLHFMYLGA